MEVKLSPHSFPCHIYLSEGRERIRTAVIVPVKISEDGKTHRISWACSLSLECEARCRYAKVGRGKEEENYD